VLISPEYVQKFPLIPGGGMFFVPVGVCVALGAFVPRLRMTLVWIGLAIGVLAISLGAGRYLRGLPPPTILQVAFFAVAIVAEAVAFRVLLPRLRPLGERAATCGTLAIVGTHFLIMIPAFGWPIALLGVLCLVNSGAAWRISAYSLPAAWFIDGLLKMAVGSAMWLASPVFQH
jgi:hypothetical protein